MRYIVTGGAGFIGSAIVGYLNQQKISNIIVVDHLDESEKWKNLVNKTYTDYLDKDEFLSKIIDGSFPLSQEDIIIHMGAISATTERDSNLLMHNNTKYSYTLYEHAQKAGARLIYASSAATYGDGSRWYHDSTQELEPLNMYGYSKYLFDQWMIRESNHFKNLKSQVVGLKFFNVYGPNEYAKGSMASVVFHAFNQIQETGQVNLFKSYHPDYADGRQQRDFIYIKDILKVIDFFIQHQDKSWIFNLGTGEARSFFDLAKNVFIALGLTENIHYIEMPESLRAKYQYYTCAEMTNLRHIGYREKFYSLEEGVRDYVQNYLSQGFKIY